MKIRSTIEHPLRLEADWLALGIHDGAQGIPEVLEGHSAGDIVGRLLASKDLGTGVGESTPVHTSTGGPIDSFLVCGLGSELDLGPGAAFSAGVAISKRLATKPRGRVVAVPPKITGPAGLEILSAFVEGLVVGTQGAGLRKSEPTRHPFGELILALADEVPGGTEAIERAEIVGEAINLARDLVNTPPSEKPPRRIASLSIEILKSLGVDIEVWDASRIAAERFGGLMAVSAGSAEPPAFVRAQYRGAGGQNASLALVGKGVTFDSGGLSLKPSASMEDMKADMSGAAIVLATLQAAARLRLPIDVDAYLVLTENMTGGAAMKLGDVLTIRNGKTVEVLNTDAEGRLILADALSFAVEQSPARILDLATLTGACVVALGTKVAGLFSNDESFRADFERACRSTGERVWQLPLEAEYDDLLKSAVADLKNIGGKWAGAITAAKFLERFVGATPWIHLDIAGPSWVESDSSTRDPGGTGCFVRTLVTMLEQCSRADEVILGSG